MKCLVIAPAQKQVGLYQIFKTVIDNILMTFTWRSDGFFQMSFSNFWQIMSPIELCQISAKFNFNQPEAETWFENIYGCRTDPTEKSVVTAVSQCCSTQARL